MRPASARACLASARWYDFTRLPGRARSHTKDRKWETFRLHGTLDGHRAAYTGRDGGFFQPDRDAPDRAATDIWWTYEGPLAVVFTGLPSGTLVLPVRLPAAPSNQPILDHHLADPTRWHKIDLVRRRDPTAGGGWRYEAHLMVLTTPYVAPRCRPTSRGRGREPSRSSRGHRRQRLQPHGRVACRRRRPRDHAHRARRHADAARDATGAKRERRRKRRLDRSRRATESQRSTSCRRGKRTQAGARQRGCRPCR